MRYDPMAYSEGDSLPTAPSALRQHVDRQRQKARFRNSGDRRLGRIQYTKLQGTETDRFDPGVSEMAHTVGSCSRVQIGSTGSALQFSGRARLLGDVFRRYAVQSKPFSPRIKRSSPVPSPQKSHAMRNQRVHCGLRAILASEVRSLVFSSG
jgi:hypothetical protein